MSAPLNGLGDRVIVLDGNPLVRAGVISLVNGDGTVNVSYFAGGGVGVLYGLTQASSNSLALLDDTHYIPIGDVVA